jgi:DNA repair protein SbcC/Rad50
MLDYLMRRDSKTDPLVEGDDSPDNNRGTDESAKQAALLEAVRLTSDEAGTVEFILHCGFADARLRAAEHVYAKSSLEKVLHAMRKVDRRVAKLMQARLDTIAKGELIAKDAEDCLAAAHRLLLEVPLMPNRVADIDRTWKSIGEVEEPHQSQFAVLRSEMESRLAAQMTLQRTVIDSLESLRTLKTTIASLRPEQATSVLDGIAQDLTRFRNAAEASSLPRNLLSEFELEYQGLTNTQAMRRQHLDAADAGEALLTSWEAADKVSLDLNELKRQWSKITSVVSESSESPLQKRFDALLRQISIKPEKKARSEKPEDKQPPGFESALQEMERAVQEGQLHVAVVQDEILRSFEKQSQHMSHSQAMRLANVRAGLKRLQGWARWSGNVSREEFIKTVEDFPTQKISTQELAKAIAEARERWKLLDAQSGAAPKALWDRFDAACKVAYAPIADRLKKQAQERQQNKDKAEALIADVNRFVESSDLNREGVAESAQDWKRVAGFYQGILQSWQRIGYMDRKDKKRLEAVFEKVCQQLLGPLSKRWDSAREERERLILELEQIDSSDRKAADKVRVLQQRWQESAKAMPLERKAEQALWNRFRSACDVVFTQRKASNASADAERQKNAENKSTLSAKLEAALNESEGVIKNLLRETESAWKRVGPVPRAKEQQIEARYRKAVSALQGRIKAASNAARLAQEQSLLKKYALCREIESAIVAGLPFAAGWRERWLELPPLLTVRENGMRKRFEDAVRALESSDHKYAAILESNRAVLQKELLRAEILAGIESPSELSTQRLQTQVEVLQSSMSGRNQKSLFDQINVICVMPAVVDEAIFSRIEHLLNKHGVTSDRDKA